MKHRIEVRHTLSFCNNPRGGFRSGNWDVELKKLTEEFRSWPHTNESLFGTNRRQLRRFHLAGFTEESRPLYTRPGTQPIYCSLWEACSQGLRPFWLAMLFCISAFVAQYPYSGLQWRPPSSFSAETSFWGKEGAPWRHFPPLWLTTQCFSTPRPFPSPFPQPSGP